MLTTAKAAEWLKAYGGKITDIKIDEERGFVRAKFPNRIDADDPHDIIVHPIRDRLVLRVIVPQIAKLKSVGEGLFLIGKINYNLILGCVGVDGDGEVKFEVNHPCRDGEVEDPDEEIFKRLLDATCETVGEVSRVVLLATLREAGVSAELAESIVKQHFTDDEEKDDEAPGESL